MFHVSLGGWASAASLVSWVWKPLRCRSEYHDLQLGDQCMSLGFWTIETTAWKHSFFCEATKNRSKYDMNYMYLYIYIYIYTVVNAFLTVHGLLSGGVNLFFSNCRIGAIAPLMCAMRAPLGRDMLHGGLPALRWKTRREFCATLNLVCQCFRRYW